MASDSELDLAALAAGAEPDPTIEWLADLAETGFAVPVTLVVDGYLITGAPVRDEHWGAAIDNQVEGILAVAEDHYRRNADGGEIPESDAAAFAAIRANRLTDALRAQRERREQRRDEITAQIPEDAERWTPKDLPGDLALDWMREHSRNRFLTLTGASVLIPPGRREDIGTVRVDVRRVGAWWPAKFEAQDGEGAQGAEAGEGAEGRGPAGEAGETPAG
jgi:hypothetical protein